MAGRLSVQFELETPNARQQGERAGEAFSAGMMGAINRKLGPNWMKNMSPSAVQSILSQLGMTGNIITPPGAAPGPSGILKLLNLVQTSSIQPVTKGLRDIGGADLAKIASLGTLSKISGLRDITGADLAKVFALGDAAANFGTKIKGLRDVTGADLAKVQALPDINTIQKSIASRIGTGALGIGASFFSPWIGARLLSDAAFGGRGGGGGGSGLLGVGGAKGFGEFYIAIQVVSAVLRHAAEMFKKVIDEGFQLYVKSAQLHRSVGQLFAVQKAGQMVGLSQEQIDQFMLRNQWGKARTSLQNFGAFSELHGLAAQFQDAYKWSTEIAGTWQLGAEKAYNMRVDIEKLKLDWETLWNNPNLIHFIDSITKWADTQLHNLNKGDLEKEKLAFARQFAAQHGLSISDIPQFKGQAAAAKGGYPENPFVGGFTGNKFLHGNMLTPKALSFLTQELSKEWKKQIGGENNPIFGFPRQLPQMSQFEKMGFNIGGGASKTNSLLQTANDYLRTIAQSVKGGLLPPHSTGLSGASGLLSNVP